MWTLKLNFAFLFDCTLRVELFFFFRLEVGLMVSSLNPKIIDLRLGGLSTMFFNPLFR